MLGPIAIRAALLLFHALAHATLRSSRVEVVQEDPASNARRASDILILRPQDEACIHRL